MLPGPCNRSMAIRKVPQRLEAIYAMLQDADMAGCFEEISPRRATKAEIALNHSPAYIERIAATAGRPPV